MQRAERLGLGISAAGHVLLFGALSLGLLASRPLVLNSPPIEVDLVDEVALKSAAPKAVQTPPPPAAAPEAGPPEEAPPAPVPMQRVEPAPIPRPLPKPIERTPPAPPKPAPAPKPVEKAKPKPPAPAKPAPARPAPAAAAAKAAARPESRSRALRLSDDIVKGAASERAPKAVPQPAAVVAPMGPQQQRALDAEISRQIYKWLKLPSGADVEQLVALLDVKLDQNGEVIGTPQVIDVTGITPSNRPQVNLYKERAVQAVIQASPFQNLPDEYYEQWKWLRPLRVSARLAR